MTSKVHDYQELVVEFAHFVKERKSYWLAPLIFTLLMLATVAFFLEGSVVAPAIYSIF